MTEQELANRCARSDDAARKELYMTYSSRIRSLCRRYADNAAEAEDMMQDAFIKIFHVIDRFVWTRPGSLYAWMAKVALNQAFDSARKRRRLVRELTDIDTLADMPANEPEYEETSTIPLEVLQKMIATLPVGCQTIFKLYCIEGLSHKEIAALLGIQEKSSSSGLSRARASLALAIRKYFDEHKQ